MGRLKKLKKIRIHREGTHILAIGLLFFLLLIALFITMLIVNCHFIC